MSDRNTMDFRFFMLHPAVIAVYYLGLFLFVFLFSSPLFIITILLFTAISDLFYCGFNACSGTFKACIFFGILMLFINPLISHRGTHILFYLLDNPVTLESVLQGLLNSMLISSTLLIFVSFNRFIDSERFLYLFSSIMPKTAFVTNMTIRYISLYKSRALEIKSVQSVNSKDSGILYKIKNSGVLLSALVSWCLEEGMKTALVLRAKEYGRHCRSNYKMYKFIKSDGIYLSIMLLIIMSLTIAGAIGAGRYNIYPSIKPLQMPSVEWVFYGIFVLYLIIPFFSELIASLKRRASYGFGILK